MAVASETEVDLLPVEEVVPPRSVLTELARGFLLTRDRDRARAAPFATTFLRERHPEIARRPETSPEPARSLSPARRLLGCLPHGPVERPSVVRSRPA